MCSQEAEKQNIQQLRLESDCRASRLGLVANLLAVQPWASCLSSLCPSFFISKMGIIRVLISPSSRALSIALPRTGALLSFFWIIFSPGPQHCVLCCPRRCRPPGTHCGSPSAAVCLCSTASQPPMSSLPIYLTWVLSRLNAQHIDQMTTVRQALCWMLFVYCLRNPHNEHHEAGVLKF